MSILDRLRDLLDPPEDIEVDVGNAESFLQEQEDEAISSAEDRAEGLMDATGDHIEAFQTALEELAAYEPSVGDLEQQGQHVERQLQAIGDSIESFCSSRQRLLERFDPPETIEEHHGALEDLVDELDDVSQKEGMVLEQTGKGSAVSRQLNSLMQHAEEMGRFLEDGYRVVQVRDEIREHQQRRSEISDRIEELREEISDVDVQDPREEIEEVEDQIEGLRDGERYEKLQKLRDERDDEREARDSAEDELERIVGEMERGLKKLLYAIEHSEVAFDADPRVLRWLRDHEFDSIEDVGPVLDEAVRVLEDGDLLDDRQLRAFEDATDRMRDLDERRDAIEEHTDRIEELEDRIEDIDVEDEIADHESEIDRLEEVVADRESEIDRLEDRITELRQERRSLEDDIEELLDEVCRDNIKVG